MDAFLELEQRLDRYDAMRYPVQHAVTRFHLGSLLADAGRVKEAIDSLARAVELFDPVALPVEHAKSLNALGAARRLAGELELAGASFERAAQLFAEAGLDPERGAALFNLGLVRRGADVAAAADCFRQAAELLGNAQEAAVLRELGATLLELGEVEEAVAVLERAAAGAEGNPAGYGGALNALGLARLAAGRLDEAAESFRGAIGAHPRSVRPAEFAMAKANLALAQERRGDLAQARLAARQALGVAEPPEPVSEQARAVLTRLGPVTDDLLTTLREEPRASWEPLVREEVVRSADAPAEEQRVDAGTWIGDSSVELAEVWLGALLEQPPAALESLVRAALTALPEFEPEVRQRFRDDVARAGARFHVPQLLRLEETFVRLAAELSVPWS
ncbi:MAG: tetratricopeptide repeat protein [Actinobacteria bacterium]|nr:tetratricopeptide repeat protein [Actinomycetota bacterium]